MRRHLVLAGLLLVAVLIAVWWSGYHGVDPRLIFWPPPVSTGPPAALDEAAELDAEGVSLSQVLDNLAERHKVTIEIDAFAKKSQGLTGSELVSLHLSNVSLRSLLSHLARQLDLVVRSRDGTVYLTTEADWTNNLTNYEPRIFTLEKFLAGPQAFDEDGLVDLITTLIAPANWEDAGGTGVCVPMRGGLVVSQTPELQDQVARLLDKLVEVNADPAATEPVWLAPPTKRTRAILAAVTQTTSVDAEQTPLAKVIDQLSRQHQVPIQLDTHALEGVGVDPQTPVDFRVHGLALASALGHMLKPLELTCIVKDEAILITTPEVADNRLEIRLYSVADLLDEQQRIDSDALIDLITSHIQPATWEDSGGAGGVASFGSCLAFAQTQEVHKQVERLLADVRRVRDSAQPWDSPAPASPAQQRLEVALASKVTFKFEKTPLADVARQLSKKHSIAVQLERKALDGVGVSDSTPITFEADDIPLEGAMRSLLRPSGLVSIVRGGALMLTTPEVADNFLETRCYRVRRAYVPRGTTTGAHDFDFDLLIDAITVSISPPSWEDAGGAGSISEIGNVLVITQTRDVHEAVHDLLLKLPQLLRSDSPAAPLRLAPHDAPTARLEAALAKTTRLTFDKVPISQALAQLSAEHGLSIELDEPNLPAWIVLESSEPNPSEHLVSCALPEMSLSHALDLLLGQFGLAYVLRPGVVLVTKSEVADSGLSVRVYDARDVAGRHAPILGRSIVLGQGMGYGPRPPGPRVLEDSLTKLIAPATWEDAGGAGSIVELNGLFIITQTAEVHRQVESFLALLRRLPVDPSDFAPVEFDCLAGARTAEVEELLARRTDQYPYDNRVRLYPIPDLLQSAVNSAPRAAGAKLPYYLQRLQERTPPRPAPAERALDRPATRPAPSQSFAEALGVYLPSLYYDFEILGNYLALTSESREPLDEMEKLLTQVRKMRTAPIAERRVAPPPTEASSQLRLLVFDLRPLVARFPELNERLLVDWVRDQEQQLDRWSSDVPVQRWRPPSPPALWSGLWFVVSDEDERRRIHSALDFLARLPEDLPRPGDLARDEAKASAKFAALIESEQDPQRLEYVLWLLARVELPVPALVAALTKRLERTESRHEPRLGARLYLALGSYGPAAASAVPLISAHVEADDLSCYQLLRVESLAALGPRGLVEVCRLAERQLSFAYIIKEVLGDSDWKGGALADLLPMLIDPQQEQAETLHMIAMLDPQAIAARALLDGWRGKGSDPERRRLAIEVEKVLARHFGDR